MIKNLFENQHHGEGVPHSEGSSRIVLAMKVLYFTYQLFAAPSAYGKSAKENARCHTMNIRHDNDTLRECFIIKLCTETTGGVLSVLCLRTITAVRIRPWMLFCH